MPDLPITVVKIGGALVSDPEALALLWRGLRALREEARVVVVHGGGPQATALAQKLGHTPRVVEGRRVTTPLDLDVIKWTIRGGLNADMVASAQAGGLDAVGLCGADGGLVLVTRRPPTEIGGEMIDFGHVGDVVRVQPRLLHNLLDGGFVPVVTSLSADAAGHLYNVNADTVASALAEALGARRFWLVTESGGVRFDAASETTHIETLDFATYQQGVAEGWIGGGMRVKVDTAFMALRLGIEDVRIVAPEDVVTGEGGTRVVV